MCDYMQILPSEFIGILIILGYVALAVHIFSKGKRKEKKWAKNLSHARSVAEKQKLKQL